MVSRDALVWTQILDGPAKGLWIRVNPRTGQNMRKEFVEPQVQKALNDHLRPGMAFYDLGANFGFFSLAVYLPAMPLAVARSAQCDQVCHFIATEMAPKLQMMNLQIFERTTFLAPPTISLQHLIL